MSTPRIPLAISRLDAGAQFLGTLPNGDTAWGVCYSPPSGIEQDRVYVHDPLSGTARLGTQADFDNINGPR